MVGYIPFPRLLVHIWNADIFILDLNLVRCVHYLMMITITLPIPGDFKSLVDIWHFLKMGWFEVVWLYAKVTDDPLFCVLFFGLLSSSLLLLVIAQHFDRCILWPSSGVHGLSGYGNDSTWEIIFKVWLLNIFHTQINKGCLKKARG